MKPEITRKEDGTIVLKITIPAGEVEKNRKKVTEDLQKQVSAPGFRKGKVPSQIAKNRIPKDLVQEEVLKQLVPEAYNKAIKEENLQPIISPRLHVETFDEGTGIVFEAETTEAPKIEVGDYKKAVQDVTAKSKIVIPGKNDENQKPNLDDVISAAMKEVKMTIPQILKEQEANRLLSQLLDELKSLGLNLDQYLGSRGKTADEIRKEYEDRAERDLKLEFFLRKVADDEKITVEPQDIETALATVQDPKQRDEIAQNPYFLANIIRQQKTLDYLSNL